MDRLRMRRPELVFDFSDILPLDGEDDVEYSWADSVLEIRLRYVNATDQDVIRRIKFLRALLVTQGLYPGCQFFFESLSVSRSSSRVETFEESEWATLMNTKLGSADFRHYSVIFETKGMIIDVVAAECVIGDEEPV